MFGKVKLKLLPSAGIVKKASSSHSKSRFVVVPTVAPHPRRAVLSRAHSCDADDEKVLLIISEASKSGNPYPKVSSDDH